MGHLSAYENEWLMALAADRYSVGRCFTCFAHAGLPLYLSIPATSVLYPPTLELILSIKSISAKPFDGF